MQLDTFAAVFLFAALGATQDLDLNDFPTACQLACQDISRLSTDCDNQTSNDRDEIDYVCNGDNAEAQARSCAACVNPRSGDSDDDDDLVDVFRACSWNCDNVSSTTSSGTASSTTETSSPNGVITTTETSSANTSTGTESGTTTTETFPASTVTSTEPASPSSTEDNNPDNAAAGVTAAVGIVAAGFMAALPVIL